MIGMHIAWDAEGNIVHYSTHKTVKRPDGSVGLADFMGHERDGKKMRDYYDVPGAVGSGAWPEWIGYRALDFRAELVDNRVVALVHKRSGHRRVKAKIMKALDKRIAEYNARGEPAPISDIVGDAEFLLPLDDEGRTDRNAEPVSQFDVTTFEELGPIIRQDWSDVPHPPTPAELGRKIPEMFVPKPPKEK